MTNIGKRIAPHSERVPQVSEGWGSTLVDRRGSYVHPVRPARGRDIMHRRLPRSSALRASTRRLKTEDPYGASPLRDWHAGAYRWGWRTWATQKPIKSIIPEEKNGQKPQNCKVEMTRCTINLKNLCIFALRGTYFPSKFQGSAVSLVVKGSHTDLHRFDPRRPYSIKTRIKTISPKIELTLLIFLADHIPLKQGLRRLHFGDLGDHRGLADHIPLKQGLRH